MTDEPTGMWSSSSPVPPNQGDSYDLLAAYQQAQLADVRHYRGTDVAPIITEHYTSLPGPMTGTARSSKHLATSCSMPEADTAVAITVAGRPLVRFQRGCA